MEPADDRGGWLGLTGYTLAVVGVLVALIPLAFIALLAWIAIHGLY
jgi:hypothetical protein